MTQYDRRTVLRAAGATALGVSLAGCSGGGGGGGTEDGSGGGGGGDDGPEPVDEEPSYDGWFDDVGNYESTLDYTDADEVTVAVGAGNGLQFEPPAIQVAAGTTVVWEWTGEGGEHNVAAEDDSFESDLSSEEGYTFEQTFEESGVHKYACTPHRASGMKGAVVVE
ncbi:hypothetical protein GCM10027435_17930 [Haloparvum alkalitolerans]|uniref:halocyanin domain-containing protein n=1 Tax=Haloparvum alkalitolerans TaxID=1042953 RepID=UPI003CF6EA5F